MTSTKPAGKQPGSPAEVIAALLKDHAGLDLRLRAWDGSDAGPEKAPVVVIRSPRALQRIAWRPGELGLARAYISGDLDIEGTTLADAQRAKLELICGKLGLEPGQRLLDMGCGWGSLTIHAAREHRVQVTGVTLSGEQGGYVRQRVRGLGLARAEVRIQDYRDPLDDRYDAVASVEMGEHVGAAHYPRFCAALHARLRPGGRLLIQQMSRGARAPGGGPFIESYITPDMDMRPMGDTVRLIENAGFEVIGVEAMREHYVRTIRAWLDNFERNLPAVEAILSAEQVRVWRLYLTGGALAFEEGRMGVDQIVAVARSTQ